MRIWSRVPCHAWLYNVPKLPKMDSYWEHVCVPLLHNWQRAVCVLPHRWRFTPVGSWYWNALLAKKYSVGVRWFVSFVHCAIGLTFTSFISAFTIIPWTASEDTWANALSVCASVIERFAFSVLSNCRWTSVITLFCLVSSHSCRISISAPGWSVYLVDNLSIFAYSFRGCKFNPPRFSGNHVISRIH